MTESGWARRARELLGRPRLVLPAAMLLTRGAGFAISLVLSRTAGAEAVGMYSSVLTTSSIVISPLSSVVQNTSTTLSAAAARGDAAPEALSRSDVVVPTLMAMAFALGLGSMALYLVLLFGGFGRAAVEPIWVAVGLSWIGAHVLMAMVQGTFFGQGRFTDVARVTAGVSMVAVVACGPVVGTWGLSGAFALVMFTSLVPVLLLAPRVLRQGTPRLRLAAIPPLWRHLRTGGPTALASATNNAVNWYCAVYLAQRHHGFEGVGLLAIATQWLALMLIPSTSWSAIALKTLSDARAQSPDALRRATLRLVRKDFLTTGAIFAGVAVLSIPLSHLYEMRDAGLVPLLIGVGGVAVAQCVCNVFEKFFVVAQGQGWWFWCSAAGLATQVLITVLFIDRGEWVVVAGIFSAYLVQQALCWVGMRVLLRGMRG